MLHNDEIQSSIIYDSIYISFATKICNKGILLPTTYEKSQRVYSKHIFASLDYNINSCYMNVSAMNFL